MPTRVILDTDIGTDVDDCVALALILASPELQLEGVTCVYGDVVLRARMALKLLKLRGRLDVPVMAGMRRTVMNLRPIYWGGHEGSGLLTAEDETVQPLPEFAVDYIIRVVMENPSQIHLICIGPLTNAAMAFLREPKLAQNLAGLTIMGGVQRGANGLSLPYAEHNIICDAEAAHIVLSSGAPITLIPLDVTTRVHIRQEGAAKIRMGGTPYHDAVATQVEVYPPFAARGWTHMHDPLAVAAVIQPDLLAYELLHVDVETGGRLSAGATLMRSPSHDYPENARVALGVNVEAFERFLIERLAK
jgi:inosine-uridine nucleoside N-ribohydrolase